MRPAPCPSKRACCASPAWNTVTPPAARSCCCTGFPTTSTRTTPSRRAWPRVACVSSCRTCAATARRASCPERRRAPASRPRSAPTCSRCWTRWPSTRRSSPASTGVAARPASSPRCGHGGCGDSCRSTATTCRTSRDRPSPPRPTRSIGCGTSTTCTASAAAPAWPRTDASSRACCGGCGRRAGTSATPTSSGPRPRSTTPDFVDVVVHSYRHRFGLVEGDPAVEDIERRLAAQPPIPVPAITLDGDADGVSPDGTPPAGRFTGRHEHRRIEGGIGHDLPQEAPQAFAQAVLDVDGWAAAG